MDANSPSSSPPYLSPQNVRYRGRDAGYPTPPAQIRTCPLRHPAAPAGRVDDQSLARPWVSDSQLRPVDRDDLRQIIPAVAVLLRSATQLLEPQPFQAVDETQQMSKAGWNGIVVQPSVQNLPQPSSDGGDTGMSPSTKHFLDPFQGSRDPLCPPVCAPTGNVLSGPSRSSA